MRSQRGFTLVALIVILTVMAMVLASTVPRMWSDLLRRERERQTIFVMKQYARAIYEFQRKRGVLPVSLDQLKEQQKPRVLRALYPDPLTGEMDWIMVPPGQTAPPPQSVPGAQTPGQPSIGSTPQPLQPSTGPQGKQVGPFIGVRPPKTGKAFLSLNGRDRYEEWIYTVTDLLKEINPGQVQQGTPPVQSVPREPPTTTITPNP